MRLKIALFTVAILVVAAMGAFAAGYEGDALPENAVNPGTYAWINGAWVTAKFAKSWNSGPENSGGMSNQAEHKFEIINHVSVAQWVDWTISGTRKDWRVLRPGIYASNSVTATIKSNNDIIIEFYATDPSYYYEGNQNEGESVTDTIPKWFSYSEGQEQDLAEVEENGWYRVTEHNADNPLVITIKDSGALHGGLAFKIWEKIEVVPSNTSSDYEGYGTVIIKLTNMKHWVDPDAGDWYEDQPGFGPKDPQWDEN